MTQEKQNQPPQFNNPAQDMAYAVFKMYQDYLRQQQQATLQYWTEIVRSTYNPWK
ncbi:hypothetical protein UFOVP328_353 [uncultured Caudovirales phage]|uniref:Uncharacterized protein n=1 Tax=uncultured Caudovirales phage TaxID=2100421 RepID=A0A6J5LZI8_9CAUD|nr:hypothetical protein UFOVP328_353 [uncultured Caudovirales phage]